MASGYPQMQPEDVQAAQAAIDEWVAALVERTDQTVVSTPAALVLRGILARWASDVRDAGHIAGRLQGRREVARWVRDALEGEGL